MEIRENDYILGTWFAEDYQGNNWLMTIKRDKNDEVNWQGEYRFRYKVDNKIFNSADTKNFMAFEVKGSEEEVLKKMEDLAMIIKIKYKKRFKFVDVRGGVEKFQFRMAQEEFTNFKKMDKDEFEKMKREGKIQ